MKMHELMRELDLKLIGSGRFAPHPYVKNGIVEIGQVEKLLDWGFEIGREPNDAFCLWYSEKEKDCGSGSPLNSGSFEL